MTTATDFEFQLDDNPSDWTLRAIYADWLEEQGNPRADSQRWMVANGKRPYYSKEEATWSFMCVRQGYRSCLATSIFDHLGDQPPSGFKSRYPTRHAAEIDLHNALVKAGEITCALIEEVEA